ISLGVLMRLIRRLNDALRVTSVVVSHDVAEVLSIADFAYIVSGGKVLDRGTPDQIRAAPSAFVQQFLQGQPDGPVPFHYRGPSYAEDLLGATA
ncbi:MAG TPA: phospholipid ABC transporter ATP-binding protein MlaF, partial [Solimonas sp.]|nr:phospholipid ABC transporter ATP-binding protein MlaF [Solimonas sp.]